MLWIDTIVVIFRNDRQGHVVVVVMDPAATEQSPSAQCLVMVSSSVFHLLS
jgi:hypothetical protein